MKWTEVFILFLACFLFIIGRPLIQDKTTSQKEEVQRQEEVAEQEVAPVETSFRVVFKARTPEQEALADIIWLNRAAGMAIEKGNPYFNITSQRIYKRFVEEAGMELSVVEGIVQLVGDPMRSDYDAHEITSVSLDELTSE